MDIKSSKAVLEDASGSKQENPKKKQVEEEISQLAAKLKEKYAEELASLGYNTSTGNEKSKIDNLPNKSSKRQEKRSQHDRNIISDCMIENDELEKKLEPLEMVAAHLRNHSSNFLPFFLLETFIGDKSDDSLAERFENYCKELELGALTHCLKKHIMIYSGLFLDVEIGKEYKSNGEIDSTDSGIRLSYHRHAFGLGEHYNSVVPNMAK
ncbi:hypothetical protein UlMin_012315 [Ulmus minor]